MKPGDPKNLSSINQPKQEHQVRTSGISFSELHGKTLISISGEVGNSELIFRASDGSKYELAHAQECCELVTINDICGDLLDLIGSPILLAQEVSSVEPLEYHYNDESHSWTFYKLATIKGYVTIRWLGESNGYYSESVDFKKIVDRVSE